jgi:hypothetical protein
MEQRFLCCRIVTIKTMFAPRSIQQTAVSMLMLVDEPGTFTLPHWSSPGFHLRSDSESQRFLLADGTESLCVDAPTRIGKIGGMHLIWEIWNHPTVNYVVRERHDPRRDAHFILSACHIVPPSPNVHFRCTLTLTSYPDVLM